MRNSLKHDLEVISARKEAYANGHQAGYELGIFAVLDDIEDILDTCAHDNGAMIVRALKDLIERYGEKRHE